MKVLQYENDKAYVYELDSDGSMRWSFGIHAPDPPESKEPASQEELEWIAAKIVEALDGKDFDSWGCYCGLDSDDKPIGCVIDEGHREHCNFASGMGGREKAERKEDCEYWRRT